MPSRVTRKFLDPAQIDRAISEVGGAAESQGVEIALAGGAAMQVWGSDRMTKDVDFLADAVPEGIQSEREISFGGVSGRTPSGLPVDVIVRSDDFRTLYEEALDEAVDVEDVEVPVVTPEHMAAIKLAAGRVKDEEDLKTLIRGSGMDLDKARSIIRSHLGAFAVKEFNSFVDEVAWRRSRGDEG